MIRMLQKAVLAALTTLFAWSGALAADVAGSEDHPMLTRYLGSTILWYDVQNHLPYRLATGPITGYRKIDEWIETKGRVTRIYYELSGVQTHNDVYANYKTALESAGFDILADGFFPQSSQSNDPGSRKWLDIFFAANALPPSAGIELLAGSATSGGSAFIAARKERAAGLRTLPLRSRSRTPTASST